jgi:hypothetical protein
VRAEDVTQDVGKSRDLVTVVASEYGRLKREVEVNQCNESVPRRYETEVIQPLLGVLDREFKAAEEGLAAFRNPLIENRRPEEAATAAAKTNLDALIRELTRIRERFGESLSENRLRDTARKILENQIQTASAIKGIYRRTQERLFAPQIKPVAAITLNKGEKRLIRHAVEWNLFDKGELKVRVEPAAGSGIQGPGEVAVTDDKNEFGYEITAGSNAGEFTVQVIPSVGSPVEVKVTVR